MEPTVTLLTLLLVGFFVCILFSKNNKKPTEKSYYLKRFLRNREQSIKHINSVQALVRQYDLHDKVAFPDREITFATYLVSLNAKYENDYSDATYNVLKKNRLSHTQKQEYNKKLVEQSEDLYLMEVDLGLLNKTWKKEALQA